MIAFSQWHPFWDLGPFERRHQSVTAINGQRGGPPERRYPVRLLRYWFMEHLLRRESLTLGRALDVCEVGVGGGQLLAFVTAPDTTYPTSLPPWVRNWDAVSLEIDHQTLMGLGYSACYEADIEKSIPSLSRQYDAVILLHILEHLHSPESALARLLPYVRQGGIVIGGCPTLPDVARPLRERQLRKGSEAFGHVSVISPKRVRRVARQHRLQVELLTGAYLVRATGSSLENSRYWLRFNLLVGALLTGLAGELYWALRKPALDSVN